MVYRNVEASDDNRSKHGRVEISRIADEADNEVEGADVLSPGSLGEDGESENVSKIAEHEKNGNHVSMQVHGDIEEQFDEMTLRGRHVSMK